MKTTAIALGLATSIAALITLTAAAPASAKTVDFSLSIGGPNGTLSIDTVGYGKKRKYGYSKGYGHKYGKKGYGYPYGSLAQARAYGYCLYPDQIRHKLRNRGWRGFNVVKVGPYNAVVRSHRYGAPYRLKVDRCTGRVVSKKPLYGYGY